MKVEAQVTIDRPRAAVWEAFTRTEGWVTWWGGALRSVDPGWEKGASLVWEMGGASTIAAISPMKRLEIAAAAPPGVRQGSTDTFNFADDGSATQVSYKNDSGSMAFANPVGAEAECSAVLTRLRDYVHQSVQPDAAATPARKPWWKFWG